jgi:hypothetical protein
MYRRWLNKVKRIKKGGKSVELIMMIKPTTTTISTFNIIPQPKQHI